MGLSSLNYGGVRAPLFLTILVMAVVPLCAAFYLLDRAVATSLDLGFNGSIIHALDDSARNLKTLKRLDPGQQERYREEFGAVERLQRVYSDPGTLKTEVLDSLRIYFGLGLVAAVLLSMLLAMVLSRRIARLYEKTFDELIRHRQKVRYLEEMASWQDLARMLAHEIKNPLTPIEVLVTSLSKAYSSQSESDFRRLLDQAQTMIIEELGYLKNTVNKFGEFARLPSAHLVEEDFSSVVAKIVKAVGVLFDAAELLVSERPSPLGARARVDVALFRQVVTNIVRNGVEANPQQRVSFEIELVASEDSITLSIGNDGQPVPPDLTARMFDPYVSGKSNKENMGLGLAIVKKIVIEHGGEILYQEIAGRPTFTIVLPRVSS
jgi:signal transduction histidine kinase